MDFTWGVGLTTAPRKNSTLEITLKSVHEAGWENPDIFNDKDKVGSWKTWLDSLRILVEKYPKANAYLMLQDDIILCKNVRSYLERTLWPDSQDRIAVCSFYTSAIYFQSTPGWHPLKLGKETPFNLHGELLCGVTLLFPNIIAKKILAENQANPGEKSLDVRIGHWAKSQGLTPWMHSPSLAQHIALTNSALTHNNISPRRYAADFIGSEGNPWDYVS